MLLFYTVLKGGLTTFEALVVSFGSFQGVRWIYEGLGGFSFWRGLVFGFWGSLEGPGVEFRVHRFWT